MSETVQLVIVAAVVVAAGLLLARKWTRPSRPACDACPVEPAPPKLVQLRAKPRGASPAPVTPGDRPPPSAS